MNSLYGSMLTKVENFRDFKIITNSKQADFYTKRPNFNSRIIINEDLTIVEMNKVKSVYNSPILIESIVLQNSKIYYLIICIINFQNYLEEKIWKLDMLILIV